MPEQETTEQTDPCVKVCWQCSQEFVPELSSGDPVALMPLNGPGAAAGRVRYFCGWSCLLGYVRD